jgi:hypothetical protein
MDHLDKVSIEDKTACACGIIGYFEKSRLGSDIDFVQFESIRNVLDNPILSMYTDAPIAF